VVSWSSSVPRLAANSGEHFNLRLHLLARILVYSGYRGARALLHGGWFSGILLWPLKMLRPQWAIVTKLTAAFGLAIALLAALALFLEPPVVPESGDPN
jgi:hypothetical protein